MFIMGRINMLRSVNCKKKTTQGEKEKENERERKENNT